MDSSTPQTSAQASPAPHDEERPEVHQLETHEEKSPRSSKTRSPRRGKQQPVNEDLENDPELERMKSMLRRAEAARATWRRRITAHERELKKKQEKEENARCYIAGRVLRDSKSRGWQDPSTRRLLDKSLVDEGERARFGLPPIHGESKDPTAEGDGEDDAAA